MTGTTFEIRPETAADGGAIRALTEAAFEGAPHSSGTEAAIVDALRAAGQLTLSLVAESGGAVVGHAAISPVTIGEGAGGWFGLGPVSVRPDRQGRGIGAALVGEALARVERLGAAGCVVLGDPGYYQRFGFAVVPGLRFEGVPPEYFMAQAFRGELPRGAVTYHAAFYG